MQLGTAAAAMMHAAVDAFVPVLTTLVAVALTAQSAALLLTSKTVSDVRLASRRGGTTPVSALLARLMVTTVSSADSAQGTVPFRPKLGSSSVLTPPPYGAAL